MTVPFFAARNGSWIRSTPATDGKTLYVGGILDVLVALDCQSGGMERLRVDFGKQAGKTPDFGMACSPLIDGDHIYIQAGKGVSKLKASDGSAVWSSLGDSGDIMSSGAFSSPVIQTLNGKRQTLRLRGSPNRQGAMDDETLWRVLEYDFQWQANPRI